MCIGCSGVARNCVTAIAQPTALLCRQTYPLEIASLSTQKALTSTAEFSHHYLYPSQKNFYYSAELSSSNNFTLFPQPAILLWRQTYPFEIASLYTQNDQKALTSTREY